MEFIEKRLDQMEKYKPLFYGGDTEQQLVRSQTEQTLGQTEHSHKNEEPPGQIMVQAVSNRD